jgi:hypothetical protein
VTTFTKEQRTEMADAPSLLTRVVLRAQRETIANSADNSFGWRRNVFLILLQSASRGLPLKTVQAFGWFAPEGKIDSKGHVVTLWRPPGPLGDHPKSADDVGELYPVDIGHYHDLAGRICDLIERENGSEDEAKAILNKVFQGWIKNDERPGHQRGATKELRQWAQRFALKPGEAEKSEEARRVDGY